MRAAWLGALWIASLGLACADGSGADGRERERDGQPSSAGAGALFEAWPASAMAALAPLTCGRPGGQTILEVNGGGVAVFDGDGDGDMDLLVVSPGDYPAGDASSAAGNRLYRNDGGRFVDVTADSGVAVGGYCNGVAVSDVDGDGRRDLYLTRLGPNVLLRATGPLCFELVPQAGGAAGDAWSTSALFVDLDRDGDLDLYVTNYLAFDPSRPPMHGVDGRTCLWKGMPVMCGPQGLPAQGDRYYVNEGGRFRDATESAGFDVTPGYGLGVIEGDFDGNGWPDLYVSNDSTANYLFLNDGDGHVSERGRRSGTALSGLGKEQAGMGIAAGDIESDGDEDLLVTNFSMDTNALYVNRGGGFFRDQADPAGIGGPSRTLLGWGTVFLDADLDGDLDTLAANGHVYPQADEPGTDTSYAQRDVLWLNDGAGRFAEVDWPGQAPAVSRALAIGDLDDDGVTDLVITQRAGVPLVWRGTADSRRSLRVQVQGPPGNPDGVGCVLAWVDDVGGQLRRVRTSAGFQAASDPRVVFAYRGPGRLEITYPDGRRHEQTVTAPGPVRVPWDGP